MNTLRALLTLSLVVMLAAMAQGPNVAGRWRITITTAEGTINGLGSLKQEGDQVTGWVGARESDPIPITGSFKESKLVIKTHPQPGRVVAFYEVELSIDGDTMFGTISRGSHGEGTIKFVRVK